MEATVIISVPVEIVSWDPEFQKEGLPFFASYTEATLYWIRRADFNSTCLLSENPNDKKWYLVSVIYNFDRANTEQKNTLLWKEGWDSQRAAYGKACWDEYYRGVRDAELDTVFDRQGMGEKIIQHLAKSMPKWMLTNKMLKENK